MALFWIIVSALLPQYVTGFVPSGLSSLSPSTSSRKHASRTTSRETPPSGQPYPADRSRMIRHLRKSRPVLCCCSSSQINEEQSSRRKQRVFTWLTRRRRRKGLTGNVLRPGFELCAADGDDDNNLYERENDNDDDSKQYSVQSLNEESSGSDDENNDDDDDDDDDDEMMEDGIQSELDKVAFLESMLMELQDFGASDYLKANQEDDDINVNDESLQFLRSKIRDGSSETEKPPSDVFWSEQTLLDLFGDLPDDDDDFFDDDDDDDDDDDELDEALSFYGIDDSDSIAAGNALGNIVGSSLLNRLLAGGELDQAEKQGQSNSSNQITTGGGTVKAVAVNESTRQQQEQKQGNSAPLRPNVIQASAAMANLERALMQGVVPVSANVGSDCLPGDFGFDPLNLASKDYFQYGQRFLVNLLPEPKTSSSSLDDDDDEKISGGGNGSTMNYSNVNTKPRPRALILRDYREAEIRHGRLAMLAAIFWPLQEQLDELLLDSDQAGPLLYGPVTLPYFPLLMTLIMLLLGYMDIYSQSIKDRDAIGEAFLPGDCFWDPLRILEGAPDSMKRNMQERELFNGRVAMIAFVVFLWEEAITHLSLAQIEGNELLLKPAYQVPYIQEWLDRQFS